MQAYEFKCSAEQSRRDVTLLTVEFILRTICDAHALQVPQGRYFERMIVPSLRDFGAMLFLRLRRLKPTVNQVLSLRDIISIPKELHVYRKKTNDVYVRLLRSRMLPDISFYKYSNPSDSFNIQYVIINNK